MLPSARLWDTAAFSASFACVRITRGSIAVNALRTGNQTLAVRALDAAMRASEVGKHAGGGSPLGTQFDEANRNIMQARVAIQDARVAEAALALVGTSSGSSAEVPVQSAATDKYKGAKVLNARGVRVGEIRDFENDEAVIAIDGAAGLFGFLHFGGEELRVPRERVLLGETKTMGSTFAVLPTLATANDDIRNQIVAGVRTNR